MNNSSTFVLMRYLLYFSFFLGCFQAICQKNGQQKKYSLDASPFYGSILLHNPDIAQLITSHPSGFILGINRKRYGDQTWEADFNYPDSGFSFVYQNMNNSILGENFGLYAHYNFYFFKRNLQFRIAQGIAYNSNPYDRETNFRNSAYGSHFLSSTMAIINYYKENIIAGLGFKAGISLIHYSNANFKAPNTSTNTFALNAGLVYDLNHQLEREYLVPESDKIKEKLCFNVVLRTGINEGDVIGSGQYGFLILSTYADKRLGNRSAIQFGADFFYTPFLKELIRFQATSFPELNIAEDTDFKRVGVFIGHELFINKMSLITQLGYYVYYPFDFEGKVYNRVGLKRYFGDKVFGAITLKSHGAAAEAVEFGLGIRI